MVGGIVGDFISFRYEWNNHKSKESTEKKRRQEIETKWSNWLWK